MANKKIKRRCGVGCAAEECSKAYFLSSDFKKHCQLFRPFLAASHAALIEFFATPEELLRLGTMRSHSVGSLNMCTLIGFGIK